MYLKISKKNLIINQFDLITSIEYWEKITSTISNILIKIGVNIYDCYLVGSGLRNQLLTNINDIDSVIILKGSYSDNELLKIRNVLDNLIQKYDTFNKYHFRLFDEIGFQNLHIYDGYRLYEFQYENLSFYNTNFIFESSPVLNLENFYMSYLVQLVYDCLMSQKIFESYIINKKAINRLKRNFEINKSNGIELITTEYKCVKNSMLNEYFKIRKYSNKSILVWQKFLSKYYLKMKHEFINKSNKYQYNLWKYLGGKKND